MMLMPFTIMCRGSGLSGLNVLLLRLPRANFSNSSVRAMPSTCLTWLKIRQKSCKSWRLEVPERWRISFLHLNCARIKIKLAAIKSGESESRPRLEIYLLTAFFFFLFVVGHLGIGSFYSRVPRFYLGLWGHLPFGLAAQTYLQIDRNPR